MQQLQKSAGHTVYLTHIGDWSSEDLFAAQRAVRELVEHNGWEVVTGLLDAAAEAAQSRMKYGRVLREGEYARQMGQLSGLEGARTAAEAVLLAAEMREKQLERELARTGQEG